MPKIHYDLPDLRAICELARHNGFNRAADAMSISPSALGRRVAKLEEAIGGLIVERTTRTMTLTPLGRRLLSRVEPLIESLDDCVEEAARVALGLQGQITVGCIATVAYAIFPQALAIFKRTYPNIRVVLRDGEGSRSTAGVVEEELEFAVTTVIEGSRELTSELIATDAFVLGCAESHPLARAEVLSWDDLKAHSIVGFKAHTSVRRLLEDSLRKANVQMNWTYEVDALSSLVGYLRNGEFAAVVPQIVASFVPGLVAVPLIKPHLERNVFLIRRAEASLSIPAQALWNAIKLVIRSQNSSALPPR